MPWRALIVWSHMPTRSTTIHAIPFQLSRTLAGNHFAINFALISTMFYRNGRSTIHKCAATFFDYFSILHTFCSVVSFFIWFLLHLSHKINLKDTHFPPRITNMQCACVLHLKYGLAKRWRLPGVMFMSANVYLCHNRQFIGKQIEWQRVSILSPRFVVYAPIEYDIISYFIDRHFVLMGINLLGRCSSFMVTFSLFCFLSGGWEH